LACGEPLSAIASRAIKRKVFAVMTDDGERRLDLVLVVPPIEDAKSLFWIDEVYRIEPTASQVKFELLQAEVAKGARLLFVHGSVDRPCSSHEYAMSHRLISFSKIWSDTVSLREGKRVAWTVESAGQYAIAIRSIWK
jgi:hypothetical protein